MAWDSDSGVKPQDVSGDIYASNKTSKVLDSGTNGTDATFTGSVTGDVKAADGSVILDSGATDDASCLKAAVKAINDAPIIGSIAVAGQTPLTIDDTEIKAFTIKPKANSYLELFSGDGEYVLRLGITMAVSRYKGWVCAGDLGAIIESIATPSTAPVTMADVNVQGKRVAVHSGLGWDQALYYRTGVHYDLPITAAASCSTSLSIPVGSRLLGVHLHVYTALAAGDTWDAEWNDGSTLEAICTAQAVALNTKLFKLYSAIQTLTDAATEVKISKNGGGSFTAQGVIKVTAYYETVRTAGNV